MAGKDGGVSPASSLTKHRSGGTGAEAVRFLGVIVGQRSCEDKYLHPFSMAVLSAD
jgi:hypothetical protein